jgi:hypothetical protein
MGRQLMIAAQGPESRDSFSPGLAARRNAHV